MLRMLIAALALAVATPALAQDAALLPDDNSVYRITFVRAAPGAWKDLKALIEAQGPAGQMAEDGRMIPYRLRHSQGEQWDFMLIQPLVSLHAHFSPERQALEAPFRSAMAEHANLVEDWFATGPTPTVLAQQFENAGLYHLEIFSAGAGLQDELVDQRIRENGALGTMGVTENTVWRGLFGSDRDAMTIGFHESWGTYGQEQMHGSREDWDAAARQFGFDGSGDFAPQLRTFLTDHADTFAVPMK